MKIVIDIPEEQFTTLNAKTQAEVKTVIDYELLVKAIKNGIPLPKGHGKLKDTDALIKEMKAQEEKREDKLSIWETATVELALNRYAPTIIEEDKGD